ncbi:MAG: hypothetical protein HQK52_11150 [Oligoflexia bacterium]|nr:hypothetical protein [Oligoflexia bacterium]
MKRRNIILSLFFVLLSSHLNVAFADPRFTPPELEELCKDFIQNFGTQTVNYSYTNMYGARVNTNMTIAPIYNDSRSCVTNGITAMFFITRTDASFKFDFTLILEQGKNLFLANENNTLSDCIQKSSESALKKLGASGVAISDSVRERVKTNFANELCPNQIKALKQLIWDVVHRSR